MESLDSPVVDRNIAVLEKTAERYTVVEHVPGRRTELRRRRLVSLASLTPRDQLVEHRLAAQDALGELGVRIMVFDLSLDLIQLLVSRGRQRRTLVTLGLIRSRGHFPGGGYCVQDGNEARRPAGPAGQASEVY